MFSEVKLCNGINERNANWSVQWRLLEESAHGKLQSDQVVKYEPHTSGEVCYGVNAVTNKCYCNGKLVVRVHYI